MALRGWGLTLLRYFKISLILGGKVGNMDIEELKKKANNKQNWRERLEAVKALGEMDCQQSRDIVTRLALHDPVFKVQEEAFRCAQAFGIKKNGKPIYLGKKQKGNLVKDINKKLAKLRNSMGEDFTLEEFKEKFKAMYPETYDTYDGNMENKFDKWLSNAIQSLPKEKNKQ
jgi:hypothetical protein